MRNKDWSKNIPLQGVLCKRNTPGFNVIQISSVVDEHCFDSYGVDLGCIDQFTKLTHQEVWLFMTWQDMDSVPKDDKESVLVKLEKEIRGTRTQYHTGVFAKNISIIAGRMGFDCSEPIGWLPLPDSQIEQD